ncbi:crossover junction endonuclease EME1-like [Ylistrum balloti]|uniref:crossover junction endonuclease EME1-like n=1 Tax=Ylistrum balloti TaxID=509963 RepID=UPI002905EA57|nr:crossover junction endonuclease EME1-like [Ylistrum balloti]
MDCDMSDTDVNSDMDSDLPDLDGPQTVAQPARFVHCLSDSSDSDADEGKNRPMYIPLKERLLNCQNQNINTTPDFSDTSDIEIVDYKTSHTLSYGAVAISDESNDSCVVRCPSSDNDLERQPLSSLTRRTSMSPCTPSHTPKIPDNSVSHQFYGAESRTQISRYSNPSGAQTTLSTIPSKQNSKKRTAEEIMQRKQQAQMKREAMEKKKIERQKSKEEKQAEKERATLIKNAERDRKKQYGLLKDCLNYMKVILDTHLVNDLGLGASIFKSCESLGVQCVAEPQTIPFTITWQRTVTEFKVTEEKVDTWTRQTVEDNVLTLIPTSDFVQFVENFKQAQMGQDQGQATLKKYIQTLQQYYQHKHVTAAVLGMEKYFREQKTVIQRKHKETVRSKEMREPSRPKKTKKGETNTLVSKMDVEEAIVETQLQTGTMVHMVESNEEFADIVKSFTKAVAEKPAKKDRLESVFSFHEDGTTGVRVDKSGHGLLKVWKQQLLQFKNISPDIADAVLAEYPSPYLLYKALTECTDETSASRLLENIVVRRGTGVLGTTRRIGKEMSRRIYLFLTSRNPNVIIK